MSRLSYISFPQKLEALRLLDIKGREKEFGITYDTSRYRNDIFLFPDLSPKESFVAIIDKKEATFNNCFKNSFIYGFGVDLSVDFLRIDTTTEDSEKNIEEREVTRANRAWEMYKHVLYNFITRHLACGQFVEIYKEATDHVNFNFGPPESECIIELSELLNMAMPTRIEDKHKLTICNFKL